MHNIEKNKKKSSKDAAIVKAFFKLSVCTTARSNVSSFRNTKAYELCIWVMDSFTQL